MSEEKRLAVQGPRGPKGEKGAAGLSGSVRRSLVILFAIAVLLGGGGLLWAARDQDSQAAAQRHEQAEQQAEQQRAAAALGEKLCLTFGKLAALQPPPGSAKANPSRAYLQAQHDTLAELGTDLGCKQPGP